MQSRVVKIFIILFFSHFAAHAEDLSTPELVVYSNKFYTTEKNSAHHAEIYDQTEITNSGYNNLFDFLSNKSSLNISSYSGNKATPLIDMRGYGLESGYQNIVINVDGFRINSIDMSPSFLGTLNTNDIERIEILKGSGSVIHGDGSNAGSINIFTKHHKNTRISSSFGNFGQKNHSFSTGKKIENFDISFSSNYESNDGYSQKDANGNKDKSKASNQTIKMRYSPDENSQINFKYSNNESNALFPGSLTRDQFKKNPSQRPTWGGFGGGYDEFDYNDDIWGVDYITHLSNNFSVKLFHQGEIKKYQPRDYSPNNFYRTNATVNGIEFDLTGDTYTITSGVTINERERNVYNTSSTNVNQINKKNESVFFQANHFLNNEKTLTVNYGARTENVSVKLDNENINDKNSDRLSMFELGLNYAVNNQVNIFSNFSKSMQSQDIDRILPWNFGSGLLNRYDTYNHNIKPMESRTINLGMNYDDGVQKIKFSTFFADIDNEIVFNPNNSAFLFGTNENIDRTKKYGYELFVMKKLNELVDLKFNYSYTRAQIINDNDSTFQSGKNLPGVPRNAINLSINYTKENFLASINHHWRQRSYIFDDFDNNSSQKAPSFESTDLYMKYKFMNTPPSLSSLSIFGSINNIFKQKNGVQSYNDTIYPFNFQRTWFVGMELEL